MMNMSGCSKFENNKYTIKFNIKGLKYHYFNLKNIHKGISLSKESLEKKFSIVLTRFFSGTTCLLKCADNSTDTIAL